jgi:murein DD-endopeptidase MepM/ murein hydrolase activator NlpD
VRTDGQSPSVAEAKADLDIARAKLEDTQKAESAAQQRAEKASQAAVDAATQARQAAAGAARALRQSADAVQSAEQSRVELGRLAAYAYANNADLGNLAELSSALDPEEFQERSSGLSELIRVQDSLLRDAAEARADAANASARADGKADAAAAASAKADALLNTAKKTLAAASAATQQAEAALQEVRDIYAAAQRAEAERAAAQRRASRSDTSGVSVDAPPPNGNGIFQIPASGPITSPYGMRVHPVTGVYKLHTGTDFGAPCGAGVHAASGGIVESAGDAGAYGNRIEISHGVIGGVNVTTSYNHLSSFDVHPGQSVAVGELIGRVGTTGSSTGCHLHFEVLVNGNFTNPMSWLS